MKDKKIKMGQLLMESLTAGADRIHAGSGCVGRRFEKLDGRF
jgi:hypothetical protein